MAHTFSRLLFHVVFSTRNREARLTPAIRERVFPYMAGILKDLGVEFCSINGIQDHVHVFAAIRPSLSVSEMVQKMKASSSRWMHEKMNEPQFAWQEGYSVFSVSESQREKVLRYIDDQHEHHRNRSFQEEYLEFLRMHNVEYDERYVLG